MEDGEVSFGYVKFEFFYGREFVWGLVVRGLGFRRGVWVGVRDWGLGV